jgi:hypothetical protein
MSRLSSRLSLLFALVVADWPRRCAPAAQRAPPPPPPPPHMMQPQVAGVAGVAGGPQFGAAQFGGGYGGGYGGYGGYGGGAAQPRRAAPGELERHAAQQQQQYQQFQQWQFQQWQAQQQQAQFQQWQAAQASQAAQAAQAAQGGAPQQEQQQQYARQPPPQYQQQHPTYGMQFGGGGGGGGVYPGTVPPQHAFAPKAHAQQAPQDTVPRALGEQALEYFGGHDGKYFPPPPPPPILPRLWPQPSQPATGVGDNADPAVADATAEGVQELSLEERVAQIRAKLKAMGKDEL